ncbi:MAG: energy transducer TonB [Candidatus Thiodiazotropha lotti]|uniref:Energy transducer TonB n=1 Tax=Candidatus Thiodiazotropha endoloripes TaxID=1818881 RepID=A0A1E2UL96_9GAMM|nr:energy transducer TonB [Candidatus Thiodiazotropha endoloripes]MCG7898852.1 energy transducer TonB [Candidatus Thiodiazotropha weberae]MCG7992245.1 energy transducer TonB [Candidatus Thiodiazotropha lotti]MCG7904197.1 energy transducer TonB [Candidatus Thiodiazotropha weberae]MCG7915641.1 energy transducer TonB [Candidatus Thiodiazotropha weberae]MCG8001524.1 energy transducer TonB [Candidatus Thiodiazotropha lotti]
MISTHNHNDILGIGLFVATALHAFVILGITFKPFDPSKPEYQQQSLEVMVVRQPKQQPEEDEQADYLAQVTQSGGGELREQEKPQTPEPPAPPQAAQTPPAFQQPVDQSQPLTAEQSEQQAPVDNQIVERQPLPTASQLLNSKNMEIARLTAELERKSEAYAKLPKRKAISASTKEYKYASYLDAWRRKVERIGNLNYPDQAKRDRLYGNLVLHVAVKADGSVDQIRVLHSSGHKILDDSAIRIVRLAAPFSPFPNEIRKETDILDITRTWQFLRSGKLNAE